MFFFMLILNAHVYLVNHYFLAAPGKFFTILISGCKLKRFADVDDVLSVKDGQKDLATRRHR